MNFAKFADRKKLAVRHSFLCHEFCARAPRIVTHTVSLKAVTSTGSESEMLQLHQRPRVLGDTISASIQFGSGFSSFSASYAFSDCCISAKAATKVFPATVPIGCAFASAGFDLVHETDICQQLPNLNGERDKSILRCDKEFARCQRCRDRLAYPRELKSTGDDVVKRYLGSASGGSSRLFFVDAPFLIISAPFEVFLSSGGVSGGR